MFKTFVVTMIFCAIAFWLVFSVADASLTDNQQILLALMTIPASYPVGKAAADD